MLEQVQWIAKKLEYGAKILGWAARSLGSFPLPDKEEPKENRNVIVIFELLYMVI